MRKVSPLLLFVIISAVFLSFVFSGQIILRQYFHIGPLVIHYYGLIMALAAWAGFYLAIKRAPKFGIEKKFAEDLLFWLIIGGFIGARLYHVLSSFDYYRLYPADIIKVWNGGLSIYGAVFGGLITLWILFRLNKDSPWPGGLHGPRGILVALDWLTPSVIVGQIIGRFGNLFNYEAFGYPTNLPWKMFVPTGFSPDRYHNSHFFHPWFLYEQLGLIIILIIIGVSEKSEKRHLFLWYLLLYNVLRFGLEFLRVDSAFLGGFRLNVIVSFMLAIIASLALILLTKMSKIEHN